MDGTEERKDTSQVEDASGEQKETSTEEPKTHTEESEKKAVSDALSAAGRDAKTITDKATEAERILQSAKETQKGVKADKEQWLKDREEAERESIKDDSDALKSLEEKQRQRRKDTELAEREGRVREDEEKVKADKEQVRIQKRTQLAAEVAVEKGVNMDALLKLTQEDSKEAMEATAELLPKKETKETKPLKTDSGTTTGGEKSQEQKLKDRYPSMK